MAKLNEIRPNEIRIYDNYAKIVLYNKYNIEIETTEINIQSIEIVNVARWYLRADGYVATNNYKGEYTFLHRLLLNVSNKITVDHVDRNRLNNKLLNLRLATQSQQNMNQGIRKDNTSGVRGVRFVKERGDWHSGICIDGNRIHLGYFVNFEDAVKVRKEAEIKYFKNYRSFI